MRLVIWDATVLIMTSWLIDKILVLFCFVVTIAAIAAAVTVAADDNDVVNDEEEEEEYGELHVVCYTGWTLYNLRPTPSIC